jgi:hypothetical protein
MEKVMKKRKKSNLRVSLLPLTLPLETTPEHK